MVIQYQTGMFGLSDHIYKIINDIDLGGRTIGIPADSILQPEGGKFRNGTVHLNNTCLRGVTHKSQLFEDSCSITGTYSLGQVIYADGMMMGTDENGYLKPLKSKFRWASDVIQISEDNGQTWTDFSNKFASSPTFEGTAATTSAIANPKDGALYLIGTPPNLDIYLYKNNAWTLAGSLGSLSIGLTNTLGNSETLALSQKASTQFITEYNVEKASGNHSLLLSAAINLVPQDIRHKGLKIIFTDVNGVLNVWQNINASTNANFEKISSWYRLHTDNVWDGGHANTIYGGSRILNAGNAQSTI